MSPLPQLEWYPTPKGESYCPGVAIVAVQYQGWYVYPSDGAHVRGPFASMVEAQLSAEQRDRPATDAALSCPHPLVVG
jgi:hypothetical protein